MTTFYKFYGGLESQLRDPEPGSLLARFADAPQTDRTRIVHQIPHWMFAMRDTLATNVYRALAVIAAQPEIERRALEDLEGPYLEGCLQEAMRLWPTTPCWPGGHARLHARRGGDRRGQPGDDAQRLQPP